MSLRILFSPGPGGSRHLDYIVENVKKGLGKGASNGNMPWGPQLIARALGANTYKLKFGHRGGNPPVKDMETGRIYITAQNHGYAVDGDSFLRGFGCVSREFERRDSRRANPSGNTIVHDSVSFEAAPGPKDNEYLFDKFIDLINER
ncbi:MAG: hypothetical protein CM1200mP15_06840 [Dehalococcoidia bacterium]|nr:MAG: hypothetical protein CM1200mP15_06840 [Dehalococcoidia bacterium]